MNSQQVGFTDQFFLENCTFSSTGSNRFFILEPNYQSVLTRREEKEDVELIVNIADQTREIDGVETRVVKDVESPVPGGEAESWHAGINDAKAGVFMPGIVLLDARYQEETAPDVAMDRGEIVSLSETVDTSVQSFYDVLRI